jgi:hypothetical protein
MGTENEIDQLFKRSLREPGIPFNVLDWEKMERRLDEKKTSRILPLWVFAGSGIAAALMIGMFWFLLGPSQPKKELRLTDSKNKPAGMNKLPAAENDTIKTGEFAGSGNHNADRAASLSGAEQARAAQAGAEHLGAEYLGAEQVGAAQSRAAQLGAAQSEVPSPLAVRTGATVSVPAKSALVPKAPVLIAGRSVPSAESLSIKTSLPSESLVEKAVAAITDSSVLIQKARALAGSKDPLEQINAAAITKSVKKKMDNAMFQRPELILSAMAAPDISSGPSATNRPAKVSTNLGLLATYALSSKFSLTSGAIYAKKYYNYSSDPGADNNYTAQAGTDLQVKADCNVIDIPVNVNYRVLDKKKISVSINTGLSSYFMLKEKYDYIVQKPGQPQQVSTTEINNKNQHVFGIANVSLSFDHQISKAVSLGVQPFAKLPLTGIGNYDIGLRSAGVSFSVNIGLFPAKKSGKLSANRYSSLY